MRVLCNKCDINYRIEKYKESLSNIMKKKNYNLLDDEIINSSESLDELISNCMYCNTNNFDKKMGKNLYQSLYYYGKPHLFVNLFFYIRDELKNNKLVYTFIEENIHERLIDLLMINKISIDNIKFKTIQEFSFGNKNLKDINLYEEFDKFFSYDIRQYCGIKWIVDSDYIKKRILQKNYSILHEKVQEYIKNRELEILYIYDAYESISNHRKLILR